MLVNYVIVHLQDKQLHPRYFIITMGHFLADIHLCKSFWSTHFPIDGDGPILWPARSPDIIPLDPLLWGYVKPKLYTKPVPNAYTICVIETP